ncbi:MAG: DNA polymerase III subunit beta [Candidatus Yonathbacteria bacterium]|nr:DNA polymerase III subunit beta [Candidatus Yonathbacteria bacterium]
MDTTNEQKIFSCTCAKQILHDAVSRAEKATGKNSSLPILSSLLFECKGKQLIIRATNLDIGIEMEIPAKITGEWSVAVPVQIISGLLNSLGSVKTVDITVSEGNIIISTEGSLTTIKGVSIDEFPTLPVVNEGKRFSISSNALVTGIRSVVYSASLSDIKPELSSIYIYPERDQIVFVATDSFRLAEKKIKGKHENDWGGVLVPYKNAIEIMRVFDGMEDILEVRFNDHQIVIEKEGVYVTSRIVHGSFPDYRQIIPKEHTSTATILKNDLINAFKLSTIVGNTFKQVILSVSPKNKTFIIETKNSDVGTSTVPVHASLTGEDIDISVNYKYITDSFSSFTTDSVHISFVGKGRPIVVTPVGDSTFTYLVMPMNR